MAGLAACGSGSEGSSDDTAGEGVQRRGTITWWHNSNNDPGKAYYEQVAKDFEADHPGVKIQVGAMQHEDMLTKLDAAFQSGDAPDVYMERGGGELADHVEAGLTKDLSESSADAIDTIGGSVAGWQVDGKTYALPFSVGVVGFWYNKALFAQAGVTRRRPRGTRSTRPSTSSRPQASSRCRSVPGTSGRPRTTGTTSRCASAPRTS